MRVTLRQIEIFAAVAEHLHFARAAEALHISQPTVSQEIGRLERALGVPLFDRSRRAASLTPAGEVLAGEGRALLQEVERVVSRVRLHEESRLRTVRLVASPSIVNQLLPAILKAGERSLPDVRLEDIGADTGDVTSRLVSSQADIALGRFLDDVVGYRREVLTQEQVFVALSRTHPAASSERVDLSELADLPLLLWARERSPIYYDHVMAICTDRGLDPMVLVGPSLIVGSRRYLLSDGRAFALIPRSAVGQLAEDVAALPLDPPATLPLEMQWRADDARDLLDSVRALVRSEAAHL